VTVGTFTQSVSVLEAIGERFGGEQREAVAREKDHNSYIRAGRKGSFQSRTDVADRFENVIFSHLSKDDDALDNSKCILLFNKTFTVFTLSPIWSVTFRTVLKMESET
jgi:hypothetical protein